MIGKPLDILQLRRDLLLLDAECGDPSVVRLMDHGQLRHDDHAGGDGESGRYAP